MNSKIESFFNKDSKWKEGYNELRALVAECGLEEEYKWMHPCYTYHGKNIVLIHGFKDYFALLFHKGSLLKDTEDLLIQQTENVQAARQLRFTDVSEIEELKPIIKSYIFEAIELEKAGKQIEYKKTREYDTPEELKAAFETMPELKMAFESLTPGRQRAYLLHFGQPKQSKTRTARIEKNTPKILEGKGLNDL